MLKPSNNDAFFTEMGYLSMNRKYLEKLIKNNVNTVEVDGVVFDVYKLSMNITYNEHKHVVRWDSSDYNSCQS